MSSKETYSSQPLVIPEPAPSRPPLKTNVFQHARIAVTALCPMFPYQDDGCMVPVVAVFRGAQGRALGLFKHFNTEDEILTVFGAVGMRFKPGITVADVRTHIVNIGFDNPNNPDNYACFGIVQKQADKRSDQKEAVTFLCEKCNKPVFEYAFTWSESQAREVGGEGFETPIGAARAAEQFSQSAEQRTCNSCGHVSAPFPVWEWGWGRYAEHCAVVDAAVSVYPGLQSIAVPKEQTDG